MRASAPGARGRDATGAAGDPGHRADIQGLRGLAVLLVVAFHAGLPLPGGYVGVDVFFVLSGFLIGGLLLDEADATGRIDLPAFFARRVRRLLPALAVMLVVVLVVAMFVLPIRGELRAAARTAAGASLFSANAVLYRASGYFDPDADANPLLHTWSLSVEEQFYLAVPVLLALLVRRARGGGAAVLPRAARWSGAAAVVSFAVAVALTARTTPLLGLESLRDLAFYAPVTRAWEFLVGALVAMVVRQRGAFASPRWADVVTVGGLGAVGVAAALFDGTTAFPGVAALLPVLGTAAVLVGGAGRPVGSRVLTNRVLVRVGDLSYGWYLWHWPVVVIARQVDPRPAVAVIAAAVSIVPAWWSHRVVEERFRRDASFVGRRAVRLAVVCITVPAVVAGAVLLVDGRARTALVRDPRFAELRAEEVASAGLRTGTLAGARGLDVVIVGDSHAAALGRRLAEVSPALGIAADRVFVQGCLLLVDVHTDQHCAAWQARTLAELVAADVDVVVWTGYVTGRLSGQKRGLPADLDLYRSDGSRVVDPVEALRAYEQALDRVVATLTASGKRVVIVGPIPDFARQPWGSVTAWQVLAGRGVAAAESESIPVDVMRARTDPFLAVDRAVARRHPGVGVVDVVPLLCGDVCSPSRDGTFLYWDTNHVTLAGATPIVAEFLRVAGLPGADDSAG